MFGGVTDLKETDEHINSICHADLLTLNIDNNRWYPVSMRKFKPKSKKDSAKTEGYESDEEKGRKLGEYTDVLHNIDVGSLGDIDDSNEPFVPPAPLEVLEFKRTHEIPSARLNPVLVISKNTLFMYGGILELNSKEFTLGDLWSLELDKMNGWKCLVYDCEVDAFKESCKDEEESSSGSDEDSGDEYSDEDEESDQETVNELPKPVEKPEIIGELLNIPDPLPNESLNIYYKRTVTAWEHFLQQESTRTGKALRRTAFATSYER